MKSILQIIVATGLSLSFVACSGKSDAQKSIDQANNNVDRAKKDTDRTTDEANMAWDLAETTAMDSTAPGGQPGSISVSGGAVLEGETLDPRVNVTSTVGIGWRGDTPIVKPDAVLFRPELTASTASELDRLNFDDSFINLGCEESAISDSVKYLKRSVSAQSPNKSVQTLKANTVFICNADHLNGSIILIEAQRVILNSLKFSQNGFVEKIFSLTTSELVLNGSNSVSSIGMDGPSTLLPGPSVFITAKRLSGSGTLSLVARGASYRKGQQ